MSNHLSKEDEEKLEKELYDRIKSLLIAPLYYLKKSNDYKLIINLKQCYSNFKIDNLEGIIKSVLAQVKHDIICEVIQDTIKFYYRNKGNVNYDDDDIFNACKEKAQKYGLDELISKEIYNMVRSQIDVKERIIIKSIEELEIYILENYKNTILDFKKPHINQEIEIEKLTRQICREIKLANSEFSDIEQIVKDIIQRIYDCDLRIDDDGRQTPNELFRFQMIPCVQNNDPKGTRGDENDGNNFFSLCQEIKGYLSELYNSKVSDEEIIRLALSKFAEQIANAGYNFNAEQFIGRRLKEIKEKQSSTENTVDG